MQYCNPQSNSLLVRRFGENKDKFVAEDKAQCNTASTLALEEVLYLRCIEKEFNAGQVQLASTGILFAELISFLVNRDGSSSNIVKRFCSSTLGLAPFLPQHYGTELDADLAVVYRAVPVSFSYCASCHSFCYSNNY
jgi:hypothetical protein